MGRERESTAHFITIDTLNIGCGCRLRSGICRVDVEIGDGGQRRRSPDPCAMNWLLSAGCQQQETRPSWR